MNKKPHVVRQSREKQRGLKFYADRKQAKLIFDLLIERLAQKGPPYNTAHVPQADQFLPVNLEKGSLQHAIFLFMLCLWMRAGTESDTASNFLKEMYEAEPELFAPSFYHDKGREDTDRLIKLVEEKLNQYRLGNRVEENAPAWVYNMRKLDRFWNGDPRKLMDDKPKFKVLVKRIMGKTTRKGVFFYNIDKAEGFMYFREKMVAMIAYFLMDARLVPMFYMPVPVDFHVIRLLTALLIIRVRGMSPKEAIGINFAKKLSMDLAREITEWYCRTYQISPLALCDSLWLLSRTLCRNNPGNSGYVLDAQRKETLDKKKVEKKKDKESFFSYFGDIFSESSEEPSLGTKEVKGRKRYQGLKWEETDLLDHRKVRRFEKACGHCPVNKKCVYNISAGAYYVGGELLPERFRFIPPTHPNFFEDGLMEEGGLHRLDVTVRFTEISLHA